MSMTTLPPTSDDRLWAGLSYAGSGLMPFLPILPIYLLKKNESDYIKFHALQAICVAVGMVVVNVVFIMLGFVPILNVLAGPALFLLALALVGYWIYLMVQAFRGIEQEIPVLGPYVRKHFMA